MQTFKDNPIQPHVSPVYENDDGKTIYELQDKDFEYIWTKDVITRKLVTEKGYLSDLASVPRLCYTAFNLLPDGLVRAGSLPHDKLCKYKGRMPKGSYFELIDGIWCDISHIKWNRKQADQLFARINRETGMSKSKRRWFYRGVRIGAFFNNW